jgi:hypothetical protein
MADQHPITPPLELVRQWSLEAEEKHQPTVRYSMVSLLAAKAAQWGADQELDAVEEEIITQGWFANSVHRRAQLRAARRPKPPSLKEQALEALQFVDEKLDLPLHNHCNAIHTIRRALEALDD